MAFRHSHPHTHTGKKKRAKKGRGRHLTLHQKRVRAGRKGARARWGK